MHLSRILVLAMIVAQPAWAQTPQGADSARDRTAPSMPADADRNANAPKGPALDQEPHGSGSVYEELKALRQGDPATGQAER